MLGRAAVAAALFGLAACAANAATADWPTYRHDAARSGVTPEPLGAPLAEHWTFQARHAPEPAWAAPKSVPIEGILELPRNRFDDAFQVAVAGGLVFFGSSADNQVYALEAATGKVRWSAFTGGPVRAAPTVWRERVFAASDDGWVYCLRAADGSVAWKLRAAAGDQRVLGSGKMISLWPGRTGVLVDAGIAYFAAGIFPAEGVCLYAVRATDGTVLWKNDWASEEQPTRRAGGNISPQGYLLASKTTLFAPMGRVSPAAFSRADGSFRYFPFFGKRVGGSYALLADDTVYTGTSELVAHTDAGGRFASFHGRKLIVTANVYYMLTDRELTALDRTEYPGLSRRRQSLLGQRSRIDRDVRNAARDVRTRRAAVNAEQKKLDALNQTLGRLAQAAEPDDQAVAVAKAQAAAQSKKLQAATAALATAEGKVAKLQDARKKLTDQLHSVMGDLKRCETWRCPVDCSESLIMAGTTLFAGGDGKVMAIDATEGKAVWTAKVAGKARGLAVAAGRLYVSTDKGAIHCFGTPGPTKPARVTQPANPSPFPKDKLTPVFEKAAEAMVAQAGGTRGYCLVLGVGTGRLAYELAKRTQMRIYAVDPDPAKVAAARKALDAAGLYGTRVCVDRAPLSAVPYSDYFANLIVSEDALIEGKLPPDAKEAYRMLKPHGGVLCIGRPADTGGLVKALDAGALERWIKATGDANARVAADDGLWATLVRGQLEGAGSWTHQYGEPGNTACGDDQLVECPLGVLWYGEPGPAHMVSRHAGAAAPLSIDGRMFVQGDNVVLCYDAYNGLKLWERRIPGALRIRVSREASNLACTADSLFVAVKDRCLRLDVATGKTTQTYRLPPAADGKPRAWGYVAVVDGLLYGSRTARGYTTNCLFATDIETGRHAWVHNGGSISHITIAIGDGRVFFADSGAVSAEQRDEALRPKLDVLKTLAGARLAEARRRLAQADVRLVVALDAKTGKPAWQKPLELTDARRVSRGGGELIAMYSKGVLVWCAASTNGHFWRQFFGGDFASRGIVAMSGRDGSILWQKPIGYRIRPLIVDDTLIAEPWAFDLRTGRQKMREHPISGEKSPWQFARPGHHCGAISACSKVLFFRSWVMAYYDLVGDYGTQHFGGQRSGCWINAIPANGLVLVPEASAGCMCAFPNMCTVVFQPRKENKAWAMFSVPGKATPVRRLAINLGAPGDRKDDAGTLWLGYPRPGGSLVFQVRVGVRMAAQGRYVRRNARALALKGTDKPWVYASASAGILSCSLPLVGKKEPAGAYTVRLHFIDLANGQPGQRVFDVKLQGKPVLTDFDIVRAAGGTRKPLVKEFTGVEVRDSLLVEFVPKDANATGDRAPVCSGIEVIRTKVRPASLVPPRFELFDLKPTDERVVTLVSHSEEPLVGKLLVGPHDKITVTPASTDVRLAPKAEAAFTLKATCEKGVPAADYAIPLKLTAADGTVLAEAVAVAVHTGKLGRIVVPAAEDCAVRKGAPDQNLGSDVRWIVDGGGQTMNDAQHTIVYLRFPLDKLEGRARTVGLRLHCGPWSASQSNDSGVIRLVDGPWREKTLTYATQPKLGRQVGKIAKVARSTAVLRPLDVDLTGRKELSLALVPTTTDGAIYHAREGGKPPELIVEYCP